HSISNLGLKKPITVSHRSKAEGNGDGFDLVCGQGRLEAYTALGWKEIPCIVIDVTKEDRLLMSLVENLARRRAAPIELIHEIKRLKKQGGSNAEIARRVGLCGSTVSGVLALANAGEERLLDAVLKDKLSVSVAMEIAKTNDPEAQKELLKAYEAKEVDYAALVSIRQLMQKRGYFGKGRDDPSRRTGKPRTSADRMVMVYRREAQRQKLMVKKARFCETRLTFIIGAFRQLMADDNFITLLRAESLDSSPKIIQERVLKAAA
ncbi:MAG: ParB/RepB/Spo0J family partition protein, partial [Terrimicrobiaceae bacterium]